MQHEAYSFYLMFSKHIGFGISIMYSRGSKATREFIDVKFACTRYGVRRESIATIQRAYLNVDCKAMLHIKQT